MGISGTQAADPSFVGVLAFALEDEASEKLGLDASTIEKLQAFAQSREDKALELALTIKDLSKEERKEKMRPFVVESEKLGFALLTESQQVRLKQFKVEKSGMRSLLGEESEVATQLKLADWQKAALIQLQDKMEAAVIQGGRSEKEAARLEFNRDAVQLLSPTQKQGWEQLAGLIGEPGDALPEIETPEKPADQLAENPAPKPELNLTPSSPSNADTPAVDITPTNPEDIQLRFSFRYHPWKDVLDWFAEQADLSLIMDDPPSGTFNYTDGRAYSTADALDLLNSVLLTKGYTLVRRERMLIVVNLEDGIPPNLVTTIPLDQLDARGEYELVSCLFSLHIMTPDEADTEITKLIGPQGSVIVLPKSKQVLVTETAGRLRTIRDVIDAVENPSGGEIQALTLENVTADEAMVVIRQLMDLGENENSLQDGSLRIAIDTLGSRLFVSGKAELTERVKDILKMVDSAEGMEGPVIEEQQQLEVYSVGSSDPQTTLQVMQTLLAGLPDIRLATDENTGNLVALARPSEHATIRATLDQMQRDSKQVEVINLTFVDPSIAVLSISKLFGGTGETPSANAPIIDADPISGQLFIRGTQSQIDQIKDLLMKMGEDPEAALAAAADRGNIRTIPLTGSAALQVLDEIELLWPTVSTNRIRVVRPSQKNSIRSVQPDKPPVSNPLNEFNLNDLLDKNTQRFQNVPFRFVGTDGEQSDSKVNDQAVKPSDNTVAQLQDEATQPPAQTNKGDILIMPGTGGIVIASDDQEALDKLEDLIMMLSDRIASSGTDYTVFYLKYVQADVASDLLTKIMSGGSSSGGDDGGSLLGDLAGDMLGGGGGLMGSLLGGFGGGDTGSSYTASGSFSIISDGRLNALVVQAGPTDIEQLLEIIDQKHSPEEIRTKPKPRMIPVLFTSVEDVSNVVKSVYADRISAPASGGQQKQPNPEDFIKALRGGGKGGGDTAPKSEPEKMTIGVDIRSNSLVVSASDPLFEEVKELVEQLDLAGDDTDQTMQVLTINSSNPESIQQALESILGSDSVNTKTSTYGGTQPKSGDAASQAAAQKQREEFINRIRSQMQQGGGGGGRPGGGGGPGGGAGGGRPSGGGGPGGGRGGR